MELELSDWITEIVAQADDHGYESIRFFLSNSSNNPQELKIEDVVFEDNIVKVTIGLA